MDGRILIVDDEPAMLRVLESTLKKDFHVMTASSGEKAIRDLRAYPLIWLSRI